jgi:hypothetical protein
MNDETQVFSSASIGIELIICCTVCGLCLAGMPFLLPFLVFSDPLKGNPPQTQMMIASLGLLAVGLLVICVGPLLLYFSCWGIWRINREGVEFQHFFKKQSSYLAWQGLIQVHWSRMQLGLKGENIRLVTYWHWFPGAKQQQAKECFEVYLAPFFDLSLPPAARAWSFQPNARSIVAWSFKMAVAAMGGTAVVLGPIVLVLLFTDGNGGFGKTMRILFGAWMGVLACWPLLLCLPAFRSQLGTQRIGFWRERQVEPSS